MRSKVAKAVQAVAGEEGRAHAARIAARLLFCAVGGLFVLLVLSRFFCYNPTPSVPRGLYLLRELPGQLPRGALVTACLQGPAARLALRRGYVQAGTLRCKEGRVAPVLKRVQAVPGDTVRLTRSGGTFVNGASVASPPPERDSRGRPTWPRYGTHVLAEGQYWLGSDHRRGYDSRYFGPASRATLRNVARPVWTEG